MQIFFLFVKIASQIIFFLIFEFFIVLKDLYILMKWVISLKYFFLKKKESNLI